MKTRFPTIVGLAAGLLMGVAATVQAQDLSFLTNGLVAYYPFDADANDGSGHGHHGVICGAAPTRDRQGRESGALRFDGVDDLVRVAHSDDFNVANALTISLWVRFLSNPTGNRSFVSKSSSESNTGYTFPYIHPEGTRLLFGVHTVAAGWDWSGELSYINIENPFSWHLYTGTYDGHNRVIYFDGEVADITHLDGLITSNTNDLVIGNQPGFLEWVNAEMDDIRIYSRALSHTEVRSLYDFELNANVTNAPPIITAHPVQQTNFAGETVFLNVWAYGTWPLTYQWRKDGADLAGATNAMLVLTNVTLADSGEYTVTVSNTYGSATSIPAVVAVSLKPPEITVQPTDQTVCSGAPVSLSVSAAGSPPLTYQWRRNELDLSDGHRITGAHAATLTLSAAGVEDIGLYSVSVSNAAGRVTSQSAVLGVVLSPPRITEQPRSQAAALGSTVSLAVGATGSLPFTYQWRCNGEDLGDGPHIAGSQADVLQISALCPDDLGSYTVTVANAFGSLRSSVAELTTSSAVLDTSMEAGLLTVSWNAPGRGMILQWTPSLANPNWQDIPESELTSQMTFAMTEATVYFRLVLTLPQDLVAYYPLDGDANDHSGYGNHGTLVNVAPAADRFGQPGGAVRFNGIDGYAELPQSSLLTDIETISEITLSAWVYFEVPEQWIAAMYISKYNIADDRGWEVVANPDGMAFDSWSTGSVYGLGVYDGASCQEWLQIVFTASRTQQLLCAYVNGEPRELIAVEGFWLGNTVGPLYLGYSPMGPDEFRASLMDDVRIYSRALSGSEVRTLYEYESTSR